MLVSVLMPVYNGENFLKEAIESILKQTYKFFEFIIINDGSTDKSEEIILSFNDSRIRYIKNDENIKLVATLNKAISLAKGKYIVRMDADDVALPNRIEEQVKFMEANPEVGVCGSFVEVLGGTEQGRIVCFETDHDAIQFKLFFSNYIHHPSVIIRKSILLKHHLEYKNYLHAEDYKLWVDILQVSKLHILPIVLIKYRVHENNISVLEINQQATISKQIRKEQIDFLGVKYSSQQIEVYENYLKGIKNFNVDEINLLFSFLKNLIDANNFKKIFNNKLFNKFFAQSAWDLSCMHTHLGFKIYLSFLNNNFNAYFPITKNQQLKFLIKSLFKYKK
jgi:glycosyltransferase involved in cell wall biosynthesis